MKQYFYIICFGLIISVSSTALLDSVTAGQQSKGIYKSPRKGGGCNPACHAQLIGTKGKSKAMKAMVLPKGHGRLSAKMKEKLKNR